MKRFKPIIILIVVVGMCSAALSYFITYPSEHYRRGIDVSEHQGDIDWELLAKKEDLSFAIIRSSYGTTTDPYFFKNYNQAKASGFDIGIYHYLYATTKEDAINEANYLLDTIAGYSFELPIFIDVEEAILFEQSTSEVTNIVLAFLDTINNAGYKAGYYTNISIYLKHLDIKALSNYPAWIAQYADILINIPDANMWQYSNKGHLEGINGDVDLDYLIKL